MKIIMPAVKGQKYNETGERAIKAKEAHRAKACKAAGVTYFDELIEKVRVLSEQALPITEIGKQLNIGRDLVTAIRRENGITGKSQVEVTKAANLQRYGVENVMDLPDVRQKHTQSVSHKNRGVKEVAKKETPFLAIEGYDDAQKLCEEFVHFLHSTDYVTEQSLGLVLDEIFGPENTQRQYNLRIDGDSRSKKIDFWIQTDSEVIAVEFNGHYHYNSETTQLRDFLVREYLKSLGIRLVAFPYWVQPNSELLSSLFQREIKLEREPSFPHGFVTDNAHLPSSFNSEGVLLFRSELECFPQTVREQVRRSIKYQTYRAAVELEKYDWLNHATKSVLARRKVFVD